jgi:hypothetical protein
MYHILFTFDEFILTFGPGTRIPHAQGDSPSDVWIKNVQINLNMYKYNCSVYILQEGEAL